MSYEKDEKINMNSRNGGASEFDFSNISESIPRSGLKHARPPLLLHSCCGPCSTSVIERLAPDYAITVFYFNPCITDRDEYEKRKKVQKEFIEEYNQSSPGANNIKFIEGDYDPESYLNLIKGHENDPEGGERCKICFEQRLRETALKALNLNMDCFTTTLSVSPHKNYEAISSIGKRLGEELGIEFLDIDFKKKAGFQRSVQLAKEYKLYRQDYCGCKFSKHE